MAAQELICQPAPDPGILGQTQGGIRRFQSAGQPGAAPGATQIRCARSTQTTGHSMKIKDLKVFIVGNPPPSFGGRYFIFVKLIADNGIEGVGEVYARPHGVFASLNPLTVGGVHGTAF